MTRRASAKPERPRRSRSPAGAKRSRTQHALVDRIISGGQTGADRGGLDAALALRIPHGGWCPRGRRAEDGAIPARYRLGETESADYRVRTRRNVATADATVIFFRAALSGGSLLTARLAKKSKRPLLEIDLSASKSPDAGALRAWLAENRVRTLNVAGPRESEAPGIGTEVREFLVRSLGG